MIVWLNSQQVKHKKVLRWLVFIAVFLRWLGAENSFTRNVDFPACSIYQYSVNEPPGLNEQAQWNIKLARTLLGFLYICSSMSLSTAKYFINISCFSVKSVSKYSNFLNMSFEAIQDVEYRPFILFLHGCANHWFKNTMILKGNGR